MLCPHTSPEAKRRRRKLLPSLHGYGERATLTDELLVAQVHGQVAQGPGRRFHHALAVVGQEVGDGGEPLLLAQG